MAKCTTFILRNFLYKKILCRGFTCICIRAAANNYLYCRLIYRLFFSFSINRRNRWHRPIAAALISITLHSALGLKDISVNFTEDVWHYIFLPISNLTFCSSFLFYWMICAYLKCSCVRRSLDLAANVHHWLHYYKTLQTNEWEPLSHV